MENEIYEGIVKVNITIVYMMNMLYNPEKKRMIKIYQTSYINGVLTYNTDRRGPRISDVFHTVDNDRLEELVRCSIRNRLRYAIQPLGANDMLHTIYHGC
jgi:hypothetical protein